MVYAGVIVLVCVMVVLALEAGESLLLIQPI